MGNKYYFHSRFSEKKFRQIIRCFSDGLTASETAQEVRLTRKSVNTIFLKIRRCIYENCRSDVSIKLSEFLTEACKYVVASELPTYRTKHLSNPVVFCAFFTDEKNQQSTVQTDIVYASELKVFSHLEIAIQQTMNPKISDFGFSDARLNEIEGVYPGFWYFNSYWKSVKSFRDFAYEHLKKFKGIRNDKLILHLKECEWRFNNRDKDLYRSLLEMCRNTPIY